MGFTGELYGFESLDSHAHNQTLPMADVVCQNWAKLLDPSLNMSNISCCLLFTVNVVVDEFKRNIP